MADFDESEMSLKFLRGGYSRLVDTTADLSDRDDSVESTMEAIQRTLLQISTQLGKRPIEAEPSHWKPPVTYSDPYVCDGLDRLPLDNWKIPEFDAFNVSDWLSKVERSFRVRRYSDLDKLDLVAFSLEGDVLLWFDREMTRREFHSCDEFRRRLLLKFGATPAKSSENVAAILEERGTVSASVTESAELSSQVIGLDESHLGHLFSNGLQTEMREVLQLKEPMGLENQTPAALRMETFPSKPAASVNFLSFEVGTEKPMSSGLSHNRQVWEPGGVLSDHVLVNRLSAQVIGLEDSHLEQITNNGLKTELKEVLKLKEPVELENQKKSRCLEASMFNFKRKKKRSKRRHHQLLNNYASVREDLEQKRKFTKSWSFKYKGVEEAVTIAKVTLLLHLILDDLKSHRRHRWESKLRLHSGFDGNKLTELDFHLSENHSQEKNNALLVFPWNLLLLEFFLFIHLEDKVCLSGASNRWCGWQIFDRGKKKIISGDVQNRLQNLKLTDTKLAAEYFGPFQVVERIGVVVFKDQPLPKIAAVLDSFAPVFVIVILVVVDRLSKAVQVLGLKHPFKPGWVIGVINMES